MHLYIAVRGILDRINRWENDLSATYYPFKLNKENAKKFGMEHGMLQCSVRPIRLYEIIVPETAMPSLLRKVQPCKVWNKHYEKFIWMVMKALKLKKVDYKKIPARVSSDSMCWDGVQCTAIGTKKDKYEDGQEQL